MSALTVHKPDPVAEASAEIVGLRAEFEKMLGGAMGVERFERAVLTAIQRDPDLLTYPRDSLIAAGLKAAQDRLLPDGREGVFVVRWNSKARRKEVTWAPMVYGIVKVAKAYAGVRSLSCEIVYQDEPFRILMGDEMRIEHERIPSCVVQGREVGCYAIFCLADGDRIREFMTAEQIRQVEESSESAKKNVGPWKAWRGEMMRKSVIRRGSKKVPALDEGGEALRRVIERVDEDHAFGRPVLEAPEGAVAAIAGPGVVAPGALVSASVFGVEALDCALADLATADDVRGYLGEPRLQSWLAGLRRNRPEQAAQADTIIAATWARVRAESRDDGAGKAEAAAVWVIVGRDGRREAHGTRDEWLAAWKAKVAAVEAAPNSVAWRRAVLERMLAANADAFRAIQRHGAGVAVIEATGLAAAADGRLASAGAPLAAAAE